MQNLLLKISHDDNQQEKYRALCRWQRQVSVTNLLRTFDFNNLKHTFRKYPLFPLTVLVLIYLYLKWYIGVCNHEKKAIKGNSCTGESPMDIHMDYLHILIKDFCIWCLAYGNPHLVKDIFFLYVLLCDCLIVIIHYHHFSLLEKAKRESVNTYGK